MQSPDINRAFGLDGDDAIQELLSAAENQWFDRKSGRIAPKDLASALVAFANAEGGTIAVGLHNGTVDGVSESAINDLRQAAHDFTSPEVRAYVRKIRTPDGQTVLVFEIPPGTVVHETSKGDCYLRIGDESVRLSFHQRKELEFDRTPTPFDGTPGEFGIEDLSSQALEEYRVRLGASSPESALNARNLLTARGELNVAGYLLFSDTPQRAFPNAYVRVLKYTEDERRFGSHQNLDADGDIRCEGSIPQQIDEAIEAARSLIPTRRALGRSGKFERMPIVPADAWIEGIVNAVVHRSYSMAGDHIRVEIFPHRIEITSPGRFPGLANPSHPMAIARHARNPRIARVCSDLGITQELGEGIKRIFAEMRNRGLADPTYDQGSSHVRLTLSAVDAMPAHEAAALGKSALAVLDTLRRAHRPLSTGEVAELANMARPTTLRHLRTLRQAGLILWEGKSPHDPRASWRIP